jgi:signal transduction histidine kinase
MEYDESARLLALVDGLAAGVLVEDGEGGVRLANPALVEIFGLGVRPPALAGARLTDPPPAGADPAGWAALGDAVADADPDDRPDLPAGSREFALPRGRVVEIVRTAVTGPVGRLWVVHDVTAAVAGRRALEGHNRRISALSALKSEFLAIVSHELRTPLTSISAFTELLSGPAELASADAPATVAAIARNTDRMLVLVQDLRLLSQLETGAHAVATGAVDLPDLVREVGGGLDVGGRVLAVRLAATDGPRLEGDERLLRQLVHTVVGTVAACAADDELTVRVGADDAGWTIRATAASVDLITDERLLATPLPVLDDESRQRSAALSVLIARAIATGHGGTLDVEVRAGETATITVRLPFDAGRRTADAPD